MPKEDRRDWRYSIFSNAALYIMDGWMECVLSDISRGGARIITTHPISSLFNTKLRILRAGDFKVEILWTKAGSIGTELVVGMQFKEPIHQFSSIIENLSGDNP